MCTNTIALTGEVNKCNLLSTHFRFNCCPNVQSWTGGHNLWTLHILERFHLILLNQPLKQRFFYTCSRGNLLEDWQWWTDPLKVQTLTPFSIFEPSWTINWTDGSTVHSEESIGLELQKRRWNVIVEVIRRYWHSERWTAVVAAKGGWTKINKFKAGPPSSDICFACRFTQCYEGKSRCGGGKGLHFKICHIFQLATSI